MDKNVIKGEKYRITVLTDRLLRLEYQEEGKFTDEKTLRVVNRDFPEVKVEVSREQGLLRIETDSIVMTYDEKPFSSQGMKVLLKESGNEWNYGDPYIDTTGNLGGTYRTLDRVNGSIHLDKGLFSKLGCTLLDDSDSQILIDNEVVERPYPEKDMYFFAYGKDYAGGLQAFSMLAGKTPMIPRYALGNWWSKYEKYTESSYNDLLAKFEEERVPISVAVIDMDWHITEIDPKYGNGWTGFTWNKEYFPDYRSFLKGLHDKGIAVTMNLHPADGIRGFEEMYPQVASDMGLDPAEETPVAFDLSDPKFREVYFKDVLHPYEEDGVDFWWIDWQQGTQMGSSTCDPLWLCNHYHFEDQERRGKRAMIFSRYADWGSHRYPIGFSGDTHTTWASLAFQPYFTSTASNIAYGWWSHDIGGHMLGDKDQERYVRWVEYGVFSPIMRLHSSSSPFFVKEPWRIEEPYRSIVDEFMRLRHRMLPYLYTQNYINWKEDMPLVRPMYYASADDARSYESPNEFWFGKSMIVGAITEKLDPELKMAPVSMYLPEGSYFDFFTGRKYVSRGGSKRRYYRRLGSMPVFVPEGELLVFAAPACTDATKNPEHLDVYIAPGKDGETYIYEDDGISTGYQKGEGYKTFFKVRWENGEKCVVSVAGRAADGTDGADAADAVGSDAGYDWLPEKRRVTVHVLGAQSAVAKDGASCVAEENGVCAELEIGREGAYTGEIVIEDVKMCERDFRQEVFEVMEYAWTTTVIKELVYSRACQESLEQFRQSVKEFEISTVLRDALEEVLER